MQTLTPTTPENHHFNALFPFALKESEGGLTTVFTAEANKRGREISFVTTDAEAFMLGEAQVLPAHNGGWEGVDQGNLMRRWFGANWTRLFAEATVTELRHPEVFGGLMQREPSAHAFGSVPYILEYIERYEPSVEVEHKFAARFSPPIREIIANQIADPKTQQILNWQDACWFWPAMIEHAQHLRAAGVFQTLHIHTSVSPHLGESSWGVNVLHAISLVDKVYLHSHRDMHHLEGQLRQHGLVVPPMDVYRLGIDTAFIERGLARVNSSNYATGGIPSFDTLTSAQQELLHRSFEAKAKGFVSFIIPERMEVTKGTFTVYRGIEEALRAMTPDERSKVRFFFLQELRALNPTNPTIPEQQYRRLLKEKDAELKAKFPQNLYFAESLKQQHRSALPAVELGAHFIGGGNAEGLGLSPLEVAWLNRDHDTAVISGTGSGWAQEAIRDGHGSHFYGVTPGAVEDFARKILEVTRMQLIKPGTLGEMKGPLARQWIPSRQDSVLTKG